MKEYDPKKIEKKWQDFWDDQESYKAEDFSKSPKFFLLVEFPYPSGAGLHVGHCRSYTAMDIIARKKRMQGFNVLYPMGWDAFGLPTENYAIKTGKKPSVVTKENTVVFKRQEKSMGLSIDWSREINTTDPSYYKWTQLIFLKLFENGLAYKACMPINWCTSCKIGLSNEEVVDGKCERCGGEIIQKEKEQWMLKITNYAERLIKDLELVDFPERVKSLQKDWIGKSSGHEIQFQINDIKIPVFTTRLETIFGCTYLVLSPEHPCLKKLNIKNEKLVKEYIEKSNKKLERERIKKEKEKTGIKIEGVEAINPVTQKSIPIFVADYVLMNYGTGAIMAVPSHDQRDFDFATKYNLPIIEVVKSDDSPKEQPFCQNGTMVHSGEFNGLRSEIAKEKMGVWLKEKNMAKSVTYFKLRDWIFSRQRYWGEPIPMIECPSCGWVPVPEKDLPVKLPDIEKYEPTETGESPLSKIKEWVDVKCPKCNGEAKRETDVMPNWAGSNWYFMRYTDPHNDKEFASQDKLKYWMNVDWYNGGMEHTTLHLLYSRFIYKFLWDINEIPKELGSEPYQKRTSHGMILAQGGVKMSKSKGNVINPQEVIDEYGADTLRLYEMFMGPFSQSIAWDTKGIKGSRKLIEKVWNLKVGKETLIDLKKKLQKTIKKVTIDIDDMKFNTAVSSLMEFMNDVKGNTLSKDDFHDFLKILSPFCPHITEELWEMTGEKESIFKSSWPQYNKDLMKKKKITVIFQINGKVRDQIETNIGLKEDEIKKIATDSVKMKKWLAQKKVKKIIFVQDKLINFVI